MFQGPRETERLNPALECVCVCVSECVCIKRAMTFQRFQDIAARKGRGSSTPNGGLAQTPWIPEGRSSEMDTSHTRASPSSLSRMHSYTVASMGNSHPRYNNNIGNRKGNFLGSYPTPPPTAHQIKHTPETILQFKIRRACSMRGPHMLAPFGDAVWLMPGLAIQPPTA